MKQCNILVELWLATSKGGLDFYHNKLCIELPNDLKTGNYQENLEVGWSMRYNIPMVRG